jgi:hypothetical protein
MATANCFNDLAMDTPRHKTSSGWGWYSLLVIPFIGILWVPFYAGGLPELAGIPYFYWYQFVWVLISAAITALVYSATREPERDAPESQPSSEDRR